MDQEIHNNLECFENISGPSTTPSPTLDNLVELIATQNELFRRLFQGQQTIQQLLQQQQHQSSGCPIVAKMASHAIFQYNVLVIDIDNTTLGLI